MNLDPLLEKLREQHRDITEAILLLERIYRNQREILGSSKPADTQQSLPVAEFIKRQNNFQDGA